MSTTTKGSVLEARVARILRQLGHRRVRTNVVEGVPGHKEARSEFDVVADRWLWGRVYVECKAYEDAVPLEAVAKFKEVLRLHGVAYRQNGGAGSVGLLQRVRGLVSRNKAMLVTTSRVSPRVRLAGIEIMDGPALRVWERDAARRAGRRAAVSALLKGAVGAVTLLVCGSAALTFLDAQSPSTRAWLVSVLGDTHTRTLLQCADSVTRGVGDAAGRAWQWMNMR